MNLHELRMAVVHDEPETGVAFIAGPLDAGIAERLDRRLLSSRHRRMRTLILDLDQVRYINSMGMTYLVRLSDHLEARGGALHLANPQPKVKLILELMGLTSMLQVHPTLQAALRVARPARPSAAVLREVR